MAGKKHIVVLTGAGISAESGLKTFRDSDGLWMGYNIEDVATPRAFARNPQLVLDPQARRMSHFLDEEQDWVVTGSDGEVIDDEDEEDGKVSEEEEVEAAPEEDPYLAKDAAGRRVKRIPDIAKYLEEEK